MKTNGMNDMRNEVTHTPGPWEVQSDGNREVFVRHSDIPIARLSVAWGNNPEANASLIAAAPELLEALKELVRLLEMDGDHENGTVVMSRESWERVERLIAKAEGK